LPHISKMVLIANEMRGNLEGAGYFSH